MLQVPHEIIAQSRNSYVDADIHLSTMEELGKQLEEESGSISAYFDNVIQSLQKEARDKFKGWVSLSSTENTDVAYKKVQTENTFSNNVCETHSNYCKCIIEKWNFQKPTFLFFAALFICVLIRFLILQVGDGNPLRLWKVSVELEAPPPVVLNRLLRERHLWDDDFLQGKIIKTVDNQTEVYQFVINSMAPHPSKDFVVFRYAELNRV